MPEEIFWNASPQEQLPAFGTIDEDIVRPEEVKKLGELVKGLLLKVLAGVEAKDLLGKRKEFYLIHRWPCFCQTRIKDFQVQAIT